MTCFGPVQPAARNARQCSKPACPASISFSQIGTAIVETSPKKRHNQSYLFAVSWSAVGDVYPTL